MSDPSGNGFSVAAMHERLLSLKADCEESVMQRKLDSGAVELDQTRQGRLSRMDAMQQQAQAQAAMQRAQMQLRRIEAALDRITRERYGYCQRCEEPIGAGRLLADPCTLWCRNCAEEREAERSRGARR